MDKLFDRENPWKGLQSYQENDILFGRDEEIKVLYTKIIGNIQTVVYGKSGIGKSSLINAGVIPRAKLNDFLPIRIRLAHTTKKGQKVTAPYVEQIKRRIQEEVVAIGGGMEEIVPHKEEHEESLWELLHRHLFWKGEGECRRQITPLLLFDQFEEIFTLEIDSKRVNAFFEELAYLLNEVKPDYLTQIHSEGAISDSSNMSESNQPNTHNVFNRISKKYRSNVSEYLEKSNFRVVIILREDLLSFLERHTAYIPVMRQNRFALLPLNEEQAAKIIMEPIPGLVNQPVAKEIIQMVTGRSDFELDGTPEIEVDAAILSLYLEQLFERKSETDEHISSELVVQCSDDIFKNFYENAIIGIPEDTLVYLEKKLLTKANRRDNVARSDLGVPDEYLDRLIKNKVLREFTYGGDQRIEFIHDILCPVVINRIKYREQIAKEKALEENEKKALAEKELLRRKSSLRKKIIGLLSVFLVIAGFFIVILKISNQNLRDENGYGADQQFVLSFCEDSLVVADNDYWKATLRVIAISDSSESCLIDTLINKSNVTNLYSFASKTAKKFNVSVDFGNNSRYENINRTFTVGELTDLKEIEPSVSLRIQYANRKSHSYESGVVMDYDGNLISIQDAVVILMDKVQRTDDNGHFCFKMENPIKHDAAFYIVKDGFEVKRISLSSDGKLKDQYVLTPSDSLSWFYQEIKKWDTVTRWEYEFEKEIVFTNGETDWLHFRGKYIKRLKDKYEIEGYYYYQSEYNKFEKTSKGNRSYYFFKGVIDQKPKKDSPYRYYEVISTNIASNRQTLIGKMKEKEKGALRDYSGEIKTSSGYIGTFGK